MKHIFKVIIALLVLLLTSIVYVIGLISDTQNQANNIETKLEFIYQELENYKKELSNIDYDDKISEIYDEIDSLKKANNHNADTNPSSDAHVSDNASNKEDITIDYNEGIYDDMADLYYGRLYIPSLNLNVALYYGHYQYITDREDSANIFFFGNDDGYTIADHNYQEFSKLFNIKIGTRGYIKNKYLGEIHIECVDVFNGYNNGSFIVDENGINAMNRTDYMMYTCHYNSEQVLICLWNVI